MTKQREHSRLVAYCRTRRVYLSHDCLGETPDRTWAWSGTPAQALRMVEVFPASEGFDLFWDGDEKKGGIPSDVT